MEPVRGVDDHQIDLRVPEDQVQIGGEDDFRVEGLVLRKLGDVLCPAVNVLYPNVLPVFHIGNVVLPNADAKSNVSNGDHVCILLRIHYDGVCLEGGHRQVDSRTDRDTGMMYRRLSSCPPSSRVKRMEEAFFAMAMPS